MSVHIKTLVLLLCSLLFSILITFCGDRVVGHFYFHGYDQSGLVFPPHSRIIWRTPEFNSVAVVNSLGFRDREFSVQRNAEYRIIAMVPPAMWLEFGVARSPATRRYRFRLRGQSADQRALWRASASHRPCAC